MSKPADPAQATARSPLSGCIIMIVAVLVMVFLIVFSFVVLFRQFAEIEKFTTDKAAPVALESLEDREGELNPLAEKIEAFRASLDGEEEAVISFSAEELNLAIAAYEPWKELRGTLRVIEIGEDDMRLAISFPLNGKPRFARDDEDGWITSDSRHLVGTMIVQPALMKDEVALRVKDIEVPDAKVPVEFIDRMSPYRITEVFLDHPEIGPAMAKLTSVGLEDGRLQLRRKPGELKTDAITESQVDSATGRFFMFLAVGAVIFLALVAVVLFIGMRAKGRAGRSS